MDEIKEAQEEEKKIRQKYFRVFTSPEGQDVLKDLKKCFFYDRSTFQPSQVVDAGMSVVAYNEGQRMVIMQIEEMMTNIEDLDNL